MCLSSVCVDTTTLQWYKSIHSFFFKSLLHWNGMKLGEFYGSRYVSTKKIVDLISKKLNGGVKMTTIEN